MSFSVNPPTSKQNKPRATKQNNENGDENIQMRDDGVSKGPL